MKFNWLTAITALPYIIMGIQQLQSEAPGATKKQLALDSLGLAAAGAQVMLPGNAGQIQAVSSAVGTIIDSMVADFHAADKPGFGKNSVAPAPAV